MSNQYTYPRPLPAKSPPSGGRRRRAIAFLFTALTGAAGIVAVLGNLAQVSQWWLEYRRPNLAITEVWAHSTPPSSITSYGCEGALCVVQYLTYFSIQNPSTQPVQLDDVSLIHPPSTIKYSLRQFSPTTMRLVGSLSELQDPSFDGRRYLGNSEIHEPRILRPSGETILGVLFEFAILERGRRVSFHLQSGQLDTLLHAMFGLPLKGGDAAVVTYKYIFRTNYGDYSITSRTPRLFVGHHPIPELIFGPKSAGSPLPATSPAVPPHVSAH